MTTIDGPKGITLLPPGTNSAREAAKPDSGFGSMLNSMLDQVNQAQLNGDKAIEKLHSGGARHLHEVMIAVEEADVSLRMLVQLRNKALSAYEEIMRMQI